MAEHWACHNIAAIKDEPVDVFNDDKSEPADVKPQVIATEDGSVNAREDVSFPDVATVKQEMDIGLTVLQPPDVYFMLQPCKYEPADKTPQAYHIPQHHNIHSEGSMGKTSGNTEAHAESTSSINHTPDHNHQEIISSDSHSVASNEPCSLNIEKVYNLQASHVSEQLSNIPDELPYSCDMCGKSFTYESTLTLHKINIHSVKHFYNCDVCSQSFLRNNHLARHMKIHTSLSSYNRDVFGESFTNTSTLTLHNKYVHAVKRRYNCDVCGKSFTYKSTLTLHKINVHPVERRYNCDVCGHSFTYKSTLTLHKINVHAVERSYNCDVCSKSFLAKNSLAQHMNTQTAEPFHNFTVCNYIYPVQPFILILT